MFLLVPAYPGCPGSKAVKRSLLLLLLLLLIKNCGAGILLQQQPKLYLTVEKLGQSATDLVQCPDDLFVFDVQHLLLYALQGGTASYKPRYELRILKY